AGTPLLPAGVPVLLAVAALPVALLVRRQPADRAAAGVAGAAVATADAAAADVTAAPEPANSRTGEECSC
ncbi:MAG: AzlC family ABC transporter permease, partial [Micromonosporaceae bacterium]